VTLFVFSERRPPEPLPLSRTRHGVPDGDSMEGLALTSVAREDDPDWVEGFFSGPSGQLAADALGERVAAARAATVVHVIEGEASDPTDLGHLQAAWALARCLCDLGALAVLDACALRWIAPEEVLSWPPDCNFELDRELSFVFETDETPGLGHIAHTRGMAKFGRPDVVLVGLEDDEGDWAAELLHQIAGALAAGAIIAPGDIVEVDEDDDEAAGNGVHEPSSGNGHAHIDPAISHGLDVRSYQPDDDLPDLHLGNDAILLVR
jgi:hypothetical protein